MREPRGAALHGPDRAGLRTPVPRPVRAVHLRSLHVDAPSGERAVLLARVAALPVHNAGRHA
jgi:hypothetical protein